MNTTKSLDRLMSPGFIRIFAGYAPTFAELALEIGGYLVGSFEYLYDIYNPMLTIGILCRGLDMDWFNSIYCGFA